MTNFGPLVFILIGTILRYSAMARPDGFDDEGEISVPRSSKIQGPSVVRLTYLRPEDVQNLQCLIQGSPTPTVIWLKNSEEIRGGSDKYTMVYNVTDGKAELFFTELAKQDRNSSSGNFTCIAANFLGRVQKLFEIEITSKELNSTAPTTSFRKDMNETSHDTIGPINSIDTTQTTANLTTNVITADNMNITTEKYETSSPPDTSSGAKLLTSRLSPKPAVIVSNATDRTTKSIK